MPLTGDNWIGDLEDLIATHIETILAAASEPVAVLIEDELPRPLINPTITLMRIAGDREHTGGMNHVGDNEQGYWEKPSFFLTVNTDRNTGRRTKRNEICSLLLKLCFGQSLHLLKASTGATVINIRPLGVATGGPLSDDTIFQQQFMLDVEVIVPFASIVL